VGSTARLHSTHWIQNPKDKDKNTIIVYNINNGFKKQKCKDDQDQTYQPAWKPNNIFFNSNDSPP